MFPQKMSLPVNTTAGKLLLAKLNTLSPIIRGEFHVKLCHVRVTLQWKSTSWVLLYTEASHQRIGGAGE